MRRFRLDYSSVLCILNICKINLLEIIYNGVTLGARGIFLKFSREPLRKFNLLKYNFSKKNRPKIKHLVLISNQHGR